MGGEGGTGLWESRLEASAAAKMNNRPDTQSSDIYVRSFAVGLYDSLRCAAWLKHHCWSVAKISPEGLLHSEERSAKTPAHPPPVLMPASVNSLRGNILLIEEELYNSFMLARFNSEEHHQATVNIRRLHFGLLSLWPLHTVPPSPRR
ncbi:hypothetical protein Q8A73_008286 [Channa argus]|nr:hypothetical protein Q8A73_008286 [Channa argus]